MAKLDTLLNFLKSKPNIKITGPHNPDTIIDEVLFLHDNMDLSPNILYLTTKSHNSLLINGDNILVIVNKASEGTLFLQIKTKNSIEEIYRLICEFLFIEYKLYVKKFNIYNSLSACNDINKIINICEGYLNNPIFILDTSYRIIGRSALANAITSSIETYNGKAYLLIDTVNIMREDKCIDNIYSSSTSFFHRSDKSLIFCGIRINNVTVAYICILQENREFVEEDLELTNTLAQTFSIQIQNDNLFISSSGLEEEYYLMDLLNNSINNLNYIEERLKNIDFKLNKNILLVLIPFRQTYKDYRHNFGLKQLIITTKNIFGNCISAYYEENIILMVSKEDDDVFSENIKTRFIEFLNLNNLKAGISLEFQNILETKEFYKQATYTLKLAKHLNTEGFLFYFEDYIEYYLFYIMQNSDNNTEKIKLHTLIHPLINKLIDIDKNNNSVLLQTLMIYLESNRNSNMTAKKLNIHSSTFFYRYHKIEELLKISLSNSDILFKFELSLKILRYKNKN
ncbi:helix-turn-helix domain-containing protein [Clostridium tagluense]|uniref:PucR family transcriptional regulator n=1 Tax=Clostridium tagluense TaxID=360422 RepID=UPI001CF4A979|nr:helix-turn-helix domain-containing protein [Clostridium tagluense]MCB2313700.1 helix-turn-helix domain-containing protein [Clostridium tagluense]MCB2318550.1 helix-turn-helix domain-containing protein [Clostridium tagluense]MCB2323362.1 helix-turn-helix domain-containing protein [Clostridium tagluense]MCB2328345.1 helix-turn-helix domain-containing protein [Clostridium tagluense]MCB2333193.1 helix-turn-helix domain-containing protein [Clostridium tagluense]